MWVNEILNISRLGFWVFEVYFLNVQLDVRMLEEDCSKEALLTFWTDQCLFYMVFHMHHRIFSNISGFHPLTTRSAPSCDKQKCYQLLAKNLWKTENLGWRAGNFEWSFIKRQNGFTNDVPEVKTLGSSKIGVDRHLRMSYTGGKMNEVA